MTERLVRSAALAVVGLAVAALPAGAAAFGSFEQGTKGLGLAGAFTARADDPSAMFHNAGGLAFIEKRSLYAGFAYANFTTADFEGGAPFPGSGSEAEQKTVLRLQPHVYWAQPISDTWRVGLGLEVPFGGRTAWKDPATFPGRFLSTDSALRAVDLNPTLAWKATPNLGLGFGVLFRFSDVALDRHLPFQHPLTGALFDVARVELDSDIGHGYGWNVGLLHRYSESVSWGLSYRSKVQVDYDGSARFTQISTGIPALDALIASSIPFDRDLDVSTSIEFPDLASVGVNLALSPTVRLELDANWTGWSTFDTLPITFSQVPPLSSEEIQGWHDAWNYRAGLSWARPNNCEWRFGYVYDESPQPAESVSPLLPDATRNGLSLGWGHSFPRTTLDLALMYMKFDERTTTVNRDHFNGTYNSTAWLLGVSLGI